MGSGVKRVSMTTQLSLSEAKKLVLLSQNLPPRQEKGNALSVTLKAIEHMGYVQIDTISVVQRAHHHVLWSRNPRYKNTHLDKLLQEQKVFEYWAHAASYLPMSAFRFSLPRKNSIGRGEQKHWYEKDHRLMDQILKRIESEGPLMAKDFEGSSGSGDGWGSKPAKRALENLFMQGDLMVPRRHNFHKVYDLTERVLPTEIDRSLPSESEFLRYLIIRYLKANGVGNATHIAYLLKNVKQRVVHLLNEMAERKELTQVQIDGSLYYVLSEQLDLLQRPLNRTKASILSPFDNLLIQRSRMKVLFGYDYLLECYVPEAKRVYGYFCLPVLWGGELVARMDCKAERKSRQLVIYNLALEQNIRDKAAFYAALEKELQRFAEFNGCDGYVTPERFRTL